MTIILPIKGIQSFEIVVGISTDEYDFYNTRYLEGREITFMGIEGSFHVVSVNVSGYGPDSMAAFFQLRRKYK